MTSLGLSALGFLVSANRGWRPGAHLNPRQGLNRDGELPTRQAPTAEKLIVGGEVHAEFTGGCPLVEPLPRLPVAEL